jgi:hypothetical protein
MLWVPRVIDNLHQIPKDIAAVFAAEILVAQRNKAPIKGWNIVNQVNRLQELVDKFDLGILTFTSFSFTAC